MNVTLTRDAKRYLSLGLSVVPLRERSKKPVIKWGTLYEQPATPRDVDAWPDAAGGLACICGPMSGVIVVDIDSDEGRADIEQRGGLPRTPTVKTRRGHHYYFKHPGQRVKSRGFLPGVDVKGDKGLATLPPSQHPETGQAYTWEVPPEDAPFAPVPTWLLPLICPPEPEGEEREEHDFTLGGDHSAYARKAFDNEIARVMGAMEGGRNEQLNKSAFSLGTLVGAGLLDYAEVERELREAGREMGLEPDEINNTVESGLKKGMQQPRRVPERVWSPPVPTSDEPLGAIPEYPHYQLLKSGIYYVKPKPVYKRGSGEQIDTEYQYTLICNFPLAINAEMTSADGEEQQTMYTVCGQAPDRRFTFDATAQELADERRLKAMLLNFAGAKAVISAGQMKHVLPAMQSLSNGAYAREVRYVSTGWQRVGDQWIFVTPRGAVGVDNVRCDLGPELRNYRVAVDPAKLPAALDAIKNGLLEAFPHSITYPAVAHAFLAPILRFLPNVKRYGMHFVGETGTLKTTYATLLCCLYGDYGNEEPTDKWTSTWKSIEVRGYAAKDMLFVVDDYKPRYVNIRDVTELLQGYSDGRGRGRLNRDATLQDTKYIRGALLSTGEDMPENEASVMARLIVLHLTRCEGKNAPLAYAAERAGNLPAAMGSYVSWLMGEGGRLISGDAVNKKRDSYLEHLTGKGLTNAPRIATNVAQNWMAWTAFSHWMVNVGAWTEEERAKATIEYNEIALSLLDDMASRVSEEKASSAFIEAIRAMVASGQAVIMDRMIVDEVSRKAIVNPATAPNGKTLLGWKDDEGVYLPAGVAFHEVEKWMRQIGASLGASEKAVWDQLDADGLILKRDKIIKVSGGCARTFHFSPLLLAEEELDF